LSSFEFNGVINYTIFYKAGQKLFSLQQIFLPQSLALHSMYDTMQYQQTDIVKQVALNKLSCLVRWALKSTSKIFLVLLQRKCDLQLPTFAA
jgi:hypothetical protein